MVHYLGFQKGGIIESAAAVVKDDGTLEHVYIEERYNRKKYSAVFPNASLIKVCCHRREDDELKVADVFDDEYQIAKTLFKNTHSIKTPNLLHHLSHAYESFYTSGFNSAAILVVDGFGNNEAYNVNEKESITLYHKTGKDIEELKKYYMPESLGLYYKLACYACGFTDNEEGHFMGLSAYGTPSDERYFMIIDGELKLLKSIRKFKNSFDLSKDSLNIINAINFAATIQRDLTECVIELVKDIKKMTKEDNLCLSGGVFNNVITNNVICESDIFKNVWCSPTPGDFGLSIGTAYITYENDVKDLKSHRLSSAYMGEPYIYSDDKIVEYFKDNNIEYKEITNDEIIDKLCDGKVLAWFQGGSEFGRRALGHRSIIANPEIPQMYDLVSGKIKGRAPYRPLACTVPDELFDLMFDVKNKDLTEYMLRAIPIKKEIKNKVAACTAIDGTTRPQRLIREVNPEFYDMIMGFYKKTGVPCVINTSLNGGGEPIVETIEDLLMFLFTHNDVRGAVINGKYFFEYEDCEKEKFNIYQ